MVNSIPPEKTVLFLPDSNLGNYVQRQTGRANMKIWQGTCVVHATFPARRVADRLSGNSLTPLLTYLVEAGELTAKERAHLRKLLDEEPGAKRPPRPTPEAHQS